MDDELLLREVLPDDLPLFFRRRPDPVDGDMAARADLWPADHDALAAHWQRIQADPSIVIKTIVFRGQVAGSIMSYEELGRTEVSYWLGEEHRGNGVATQALSDFVTYVNPCRPLYARVACDNTSSLRVLQKCGFVVNGRDWVDASDDGIDELLLVLDVNAR
jgi:RimJ/RimL family protein N-acetyltransferase